MITRDSTLKEVYATAIGHDVIRKLMLQMSLPARALENPLVLRIRLKSLPRLAGLFKVNIDEGLIDTLVRFINSEDDRLSPSDDPVTEKWWKEAVFYQIYPRSFRDSDGDGTGDIRGIMEKLDYLKDLGIDALWLSPIYDSPNDDNGYDIRDYRSIMKEFGTMEDFDELLTMVHERGMRLIMDLVINHTSDEHEWFQSAISDPDSVYRDYYYLYPSDGTVRLNGRPIEGDIPPNNWTSFFSGAAWSKYGDDGLFGLHLFSKKQPDLNWECEALRDDIIDTINFWLDKGVDGFRMDVANYYSKENLADGDETIGEMFGFTGIEHYMYGPRLHEYYRLLRDRAFAPHDAFTVGETAGIGMEMARLVTSEKRGELDMIFSFDHLENPGHVRFDDYRYDLNFYRDHIIEWMEDYGNDCWSALFYDNHDNPRMLSKVDPDTKHRFALASLLCVMQLTLKGTPFIYQGDEMGLTNYDFTSMDEIYDIESKNKYKEMTDSGISEDEAFATILAGTREHARVPLPWEDRIQDVCEHLRQKADARVTEVYKEMIALRHAHRALIYGDFKVINKASGHFTYARDDGRERFVIDLNLTDRACGKAFVDSDYDLIYGPTAEKNNLGFLSPYESRVWRYKI